MKRFIQWAILLVVVLVVACTPEAPPPEPPPPEKPEPAAEALVPVDWQALPGWAVKDHRPALQTFIKGCRALKHRKGWQSVCAKAKELPASSAATARDFFEQHFTAYRVQNRDGSVEGTITGYYGPELKARRKPDATYRYPLYRHPDDMLVIDLDDVYPGLRKYRLRGRVQGKKVVPYWTRKEIDANPGLLKGAELFWVSDPVDLFFLHIQGSGRVALPDGEKVMVGYANQNGHPYRSIGRLLLERGEMTRDQMSMQNIRAWARKHPRQKWDLLAENPSYVFFRTLPPEMITPPGAMGIPLTPERSLAVDRSTISLGSPIYLDTVRPDNGKPLQRLMVAQDTGGAIKGRVRADFFWGMGAEAGSLAGRMKRDGRLWVLLPKGVKP